LPYALPISYADDALPEPATTKDFLVVQTEGARKVSRQLKHYNLDAIISHYSKQSRISIIFCCYVQQELRRITLLEINAAALFCLWIFCIATTNSLTRKANQLSTIPV